MSDVARRRRTGQRAARVRRQLVAARAERTDGPVAPGGTRPPKSIGHTRTVVMLALIVVYRRDGRATLRSVAAEAGTSHDTVFRALKHLARAGLVAYEGAGTLRPLFDAHLPGRTTA